MHPLPNLMTFAKSEARRQLKERCLRGILISGYVRSPKQGLQEVFAFAEGNWREESKLTAKRQRV